MRAQHGQVTRRRERAWAWHWHAGDATGRGTDAAVLWHLFDAVRVSRWDGRGRLGDGTEQGKQVGAATSTRARVQRAYWACTVSGGTCWTRLVRVGAPGVAWAGKMGG